MENALSDRAQFLIEASLARNTRLSYDGSMRRFQQWCLSEGRTSLPAEPETLADYIGSLYGAGFKASTIRTYTAGICSTHRDAGHQDPGTHRFVYRALQGAMRLRGMRPSRKTPTEMEHLARILGVIPSDLVGLRDKALLTIGFVGAMRRSGVVAIDVEDVTFTADGATVLIRRSKTDPFAHGISIAIPDGTMLLVATTLRQWLAAAKITKGPVFRPIYQGCVIDRRIHPTIGPRILKKYVAEAGLDPAHIPDIRSARALLPRLPMPAPTLWRSWVIPGTVRRVNCANMSEKPTCSKIIRERVSSR